MNNGKDSPKPYIRFKNSSTPGINEMLLWDIVSETKLRAAAARFPLIVKEIREDRIGSDVRYNRSDLSELIESQFACLGMEDREAICLTVAFCIPEFVGHDGAKKFFELPVDIKASIEWLGDLTEDFTFLTSDIARLLAAWWLANADHHPSLRKPPALFSRILKGLTRAHDDGIWVIDDLMKALLMELRQKYLIPEAPLNERPVPLKARTQFVEQLTLLSGVSRVDGKDLHIVARPAFYRSLMSQADLDIAYAQYIDEVQKCAQEFSTWLQRVQSATHWNMKRLQLVLGEVGGCDGYNHQPNRLAGLAGTEHLKILSYASSGLQKRNFLNFPARIGLRKIERAIEQKENDVLQQIDTIFSIPHPNWLFERERFIAEFEDLQFEKMELLQPGHYKFPEYRQDRGSSKKAIDWNNETHLTNVLRNRPVIDHHWVEEIGRNQSQFGSSVDSGSWSRTKNPAINYLAGNYEFASSLRQLVSKSGTDVTPDGEWLFKAGKFLDKYDCEVVKQSLRDWLPGLLVRQSAEESEQALARFAAAQKYRQQFELIYAVVPDETKAAQIALMMPSQTPWKDISSKQIADTAPKPNLPILTSSRDAILGAIGILGLLADTADIDLIGKISELNLSNWNRFDVEDYKPLAVALRGVWAIHNISNDGSKSTLERLLIKTKDREMVVLIGELLHSNAA